MKREITVGFRTDPQEHQLVLSIAKQMDRTPSDALRILVRRAALELGVTAGQNDRKQDAAELQAA